MKTINIRRSAKPNAKRFFKVAATVLACATALCAMFSLTACSGGAGNKLICGVTIYEPMNYQDENGEWTGFDTEFARLVGEKLGMEVEFQEIKWESKYSELESGSINCIWNAFTANATETDGTERAAMVDFSYSYMLNQQSIVVKTDRLGEFSTLEALAGKKASSEKGSAGETVATAAVGESGTVVESAAQINSFVEVKSGAVDCAVVDLLLAQKMCGSGDYADLSVADIELDSEIYAVGFKKGSALRDKVNEAMAELEAEGALAALAQKYSLENTFLLDKTYAG